MEKTMSNIWKRNTLMIYLLLTIIIFLIIAIVILLNKLVLYWINEWAEDFFSLNPKYDKNKHD